MARYRNRRDISRKQPTHPKDPPDVRRSWIRDMFRVHPGLSIEGSEGAMVQMKNRYGKAMDPKELHEMRAAARKERQDAFDWCRTRLRERPSRPLRSDKGDGLAEQATRKFNLSAPSIHDLINLRDEIIREGRNGKPPTVDLKVPLLRDQLSHMTAPEVAPTPEAEAKAEPEPEPTPTPDPKPEPMANKAHKAHKAAAIQGHPPFHLLLRKLREAEGLSRYDLSRKIGLTECAVAQWEAGINQPMGRNAARLVKALPRIEGAALAPRSGSSGGKFLRPASLFSLDLIDAREGAGFSTKDLGDLVVVSSSSVSSWEAGRSYPTPANLEKLAEYFPSMKKYVRSNETDVRSQPAPAPAPALNGSEVDVAVELQRISVKYSAAKSEMLSVEENFAAIGLELADAQIALRGALEAVELAKARVAESEQKHAESKKSLDAARSVETSLKRNVLELVERM